MAALEDDRRVDLPTVEPDLAGPFSLDSRLIWIVGVFFVGLAASIYSHSVGVAWAGLLFDIALALSYYGLVHKKAFDRGRSSALSVGYQWSSRQFWRLTGASKGYTENPELGELISQEQPSSRPKPIKQIGKVHINSYRVSNGVLGWAWDLRNNVYSATILCHFSSFLNASTATQDRRRNAFAGLLDTVSESDDLLHRLIWRDQTLIGEHQDIQDTLQTIQRGAGLTREDCPNQELVLASIAKQSADAQFHRTTMTVSFLKPRIEKEAKSSGMSPEEVLANQLSNFLAQARGPENGPSPIGLTSAQVLTYNTMVMENRLALDPVYAQFFWQEWLAARDESEMLDEQIAWPGNWDFNPKNYCQLGDTYHVCSYIPDFAKRGMPADQFWNVVRTPVRKTVSVVFQMLNPEQGMKHAEVSRAAATNIQQERILTNRQQKARHDFAVDDALRFEREVASRQGRVGRVRAYIDLWGPSLEEVMAAQPKLRAAFIDSRFRQESLEGRQHLGIYAMMPIGRGLESSPNSLLRWLGM